MVLTIDGRIVENQIKRTFYGTLFDPFVISESPDFGLALEPCAGEPLAIGADGKMVTAKLMGFRKGLSERILRIVGGVHANGRCSRC